MPAENTNSPWSRLPAWASRLGFFVGALVLHLVFFLLLATFVVWKAQKPAAPEEFQVASVKLTPPPPAPPPPPPPVAPPMNNVMAPQASMVSTPTLPTTIQLARPDVLDFSKTANDVLGHFEGKLPSASAGSGDGSGGLSSDYGSNSATQEGLIGSIYDLKQTPDGTPTDIAETPEESSETEDTCAPDWAASSATLHGLDFIRRFVKTWDFSLLDNYYKAPVTLSTTQICIPTGPSARAPRAYNVDGKIRARRWIAIYTGNIVPPETGRYRFIGIGDDFLIVQIAGQNVLDGSLKGEEIVPTANGMDNVGPYSCGSWVHLEIHVPVTMKVLIGEGPGGDSGFVLMVQKEGDDSPTGDYPIFQLKDGPTPVGAPLPPSKKTLLFQLPPTS